MRYKVETHDRVIEHLNKEHKTSLLAYAWRICSKYDAKDSEVVDVEQDSFTLEYTNKDGSVGREKVIFAIALGRMDPVEEEELKDIFHQLHEKALTWWIPPNLFGVVFVVVAQWMLLPLLTFPELQRNVFGQNIEVLDCLKRSIEPYLNWLHISLFEIFLISSLLHLLEAIGAVWILISSLKVKSVKVVVSWFISVLCFGYFSFGWLLKLTRITNQLNQAEKDE